MPETHRKLVVRHHLPGRRAWLLAGGGLLGLALVYFAFELGRFDAGYRVVEAAQGALATFRRISSLEDENARLRTQLEAADLKARVDREGYKQVEKSLGDMQSQIARLNQDLAFYRGLVQPEANYAVKVQHMQIQPEANHVRLKFVMMQTSKADKPVNGSIVLNFEGLQSGRPVTLPLTTVSPKKRPALAYSFHYFQEFDEILQMPRDFQATRVNVEIRAGRSTTASVHQAFAWRTSGLPIEPDSNKGEAHVQAETY